MISEVYYSLFFYRSVNSSVLQALVFYHLNMAVINWNASCFVPNPVCTHWVCTPELIMLSLPSPSMDLILFH